MAEPPVEMEPGWLAREIAAAKAEIATWSPAMQALTPTARWKAAKKMTDREKLAPMTPGARREAALDAALEACEGASVVDEWGRIRDALYSHGAAAIEAALAEQRARIVAWIEFEGALQEQMGSVSLGQACLGVATAVRDGEPEAWAERTGWKMEETPNDAA